MMFSSIVYGIARLGSASRFPDGAQNGDRSPCPNRDQEQEQRYTAPIGRLVLVLLRSAFGLAPCGTAPTLERMRHRAR